ncbi:uncharacterized protein LOC120331088 [Styela clava]
MSALHWEARRKQAVIDRKAEQRNKSDPIPDEAPDPYEKLKKASVAEDLRWDTATPTTTLFNRSQTKLEKRKQDNSTNAISKDEKCEPHQENKTYSAKISNRYSSIDYVQQY